MADNPNPQLDAASPTVEGPTLAERRKRWLGILAAVVIGLALLFTAYHFLIGVRHVSTDNAYVGADTAQVTPLVAGPVQTVRVANTQIVHKGDILVTIDPSDFQIAVARTAADLAAAERQFQQTSSTGGALQAQVNARDSDIQRAQAEMVAAQSASHDDRRRRSTDARPAGGRHGVDDLSQSSRDRND